MIPLSRFERARAKLADGWQNRAVSLKMLSFGMIGLFNSAVDYSVFLLARAALARSASAASAFHALAQSCHCGSAAGMTLIGANTISWLVAVSSSYVLNSSITFAAESGRKLRWRAYFTFAGSGLAGWIVNTATLVFAVEILLFPAFLAKALAILASFVVNFSLSHFVVFRARPQPMKKMGGKF